MTQVWCDVRIKDCGNTKAPIDEIPHPLVIETMDLLSELSDYQKDKVYFIHMNHTNQMLNSNSDITKDVLSKGFNIARLGQKFYL